MRYTIEQMEKKCASCVKKMKENNMTSVELPENFTFDNKPTVKLKLGLYKYDRKSGKIVNTKRNLHKLLNSQNLKEKKHGADK